MNRAPRISRTRQSGQTLISMMVGVLISILTITAMLSLYKVLIGVSGNASRTAQRDAQIASALLAAQIELQQAGFGISDTADVLAIAGDDHQVVWRYNEVLPATGSLCAGLRLNERSLHFLPPKSCIASDIATLADDDSWGSGPLAPIPLASDVAWFVPENPDGTQAMEDHVVDLADVHFLMDSSVACSLPYAQQEGLDPAGQRLSLTSGTATLFTACLPNIASVATSLPPSPESGSETAGSP